MIYKKWYSWKFGKEILTGKTREKTLLYCKMGCFKAKSFLLGKLCDFRLVHVLFVWYFGTLFLDKNLLWFLAEKKKLFWTNKKFAYIIFKLADRMHSMRTNGASKNRDYCDPKWSSFSSWANGAHGLRLPDKWSELIFVTYGGAGGLHGGPLGFPNFYQHPKIS